MANNIRALAAKCTFAVVDKGRSLADELPTQAAKIDPKDKGLLQELCYGVIRYLPELENNVRQLMDKPLTGKQRVAHFLLLVGIYQLKYMRIPDHACVAETVNAAPAIKCNHLKGLINGVLRNFLRNDKDENQQLPDAIAYNHPGWFIKKIKAGYPNSWQQILDANQQKPPMWIRVNQLHHTTNEYLNKLQAVDIEVTCIDKYANAILLAKPVDVFKLPGFDQGHVSVQDAAAQQAARLLDCQENEHILDCCAAPGGKTCHILEYSPNIASMTAIDIEPKRLERVKENLARLNLSANVIAADAATKEGWWDGQLFDRILLDAPCSGTGVIRRHPDIKWLRKSADIDVLTAIQKQILKNCWSLLKPGGTLLYATCSILPEENYQQVQHFIENNNDAELLPIDEKTSIGWQLITGENNMDGFYYALIKKAS